MSKIFFSLLIFALISYSLCLYCEDKSYCRGTCCKQTNGRTTCCSELVNAVCCDGGKTCCKAPYTCNMISGKCDDKIAQPNEFLAYLQSPIESIDQISTEETIEGTPIDLLKCLKDIKPVINDIKVVLADYKDGKKEEIKAALLKLATDGYKLSVDCMKFIKDI